MTESMTRASDNTTCGISNQFRASRVKILREKKNNAADDTFFAADFSGFLENVCSGEMRGKRRGTVMMEEEKEEDARGKLMVLINRSSRRARAGTISEA